MVGFLKRLGKPKRSNKRHHPSPHRIKAVSRAIEAPTVQTAYVDRWWTVDGLKLHARDYPGEAGDARAPVVCLHGLTRNAADFSDLAPKIAATGRRVLALDVRGRGKSAWDPEPFRYHPGVYAQDVIELLQKLAVSRAVFIGTSMGGIISMVLASLRPDMVEAAVLNDVGLRVSPDGLARIISYVGKTDPVASWGEAAAYVRAINGSAFPHYTDPDWLTFAHRLFEPAPNGKLRLAYDPKIADPILAGAGAPAPDMTAWFIALTAGRRSLLVHGALSDVLDRPTVSEMQLLAPGMDYAEVPGVGHAPTLAEPHALSAIMRLLKEVG